MRNGTAARDEEKQVKKSNVMAVVYNTVLQLDMLHLAVSWQ